VIGKDRDALLFHPGEEAWQVAFAVEDDRKAALERLGLQLLFSGPLWHLSSTLLMEGSLELAERGVRLSNDLWVREVCHLSEKRHQSSILSTDYRSDLSRVLLQFDADQRVSVDWSTEFEPNRRRLWSVLTPPLRGILRVAGSGLDGASFATLWLRFAGCARV
jgi:hypothetical protein